MKTILRREFLDHIQSLQFMALLALAVILFAGNGLIFVKSYSQRIDAYQKNLAFMQEQEWKSTVRLQLYRRPSSLLFIAEGGDIIRPSEYYLLPKGALSAGEQNLRTFKMPTVPTLDWSFIIGTLFSLYTILLGYSTVSWEREQGTLRLVLANSLGRVHLLTAKYLSVLSVIAVPLLAGTLVSLIIIGTLVPQAMTLANVSRIVLVLLLALAYVSLFAFLSLLFSSIISRSSLVLLTLLAIWVLFAIVIPSSSLVLVDKLSSAPREIQAARMFEPMVQKEVWEKIDAIVAGAGRGEYKTEEEVRAGTDHAFEEGQNRVKQFYEDFGKSEKARAAQAKNLSRLSPLALFQYASEDIVQSGDGGEDEFLRQVREYSRIYDAYIQKKLGKIIVTSDWSFSKNIGFHGKTIRIESPEALEYEGDKSDFPVFSERRPSLSKGLKSALGDLAGLILWNIVLAGLAFSAFIRTDVR